MTQDTVYTRATRYALRQAIAKIPAAARAGGATADAMMTRCGMALLGRIKQAFIAKARGGTDEAGESWKPLSRAYVAYGRRHRKIAGDPNQSRVFSRAKNLPWIPKSAGRAKYTPSYALTDAQLKRWHEVNRKSGARKAWFVLKSEGATTLMEQYGDMQVDVLRDTGVLYNSLSPGSGSAEQVFRLGHGEVIVGTNRKYSWVHHHGSKDGRIPQRRLWAEPRKWPASWWQDIVEQARAGLIDIAQQLMGAAR